MENIYVDSQMHCHRVDDGTMTAVNTVFFEGKCDTFVEGYNYDTRKGYSRFYPWKPYAELDAAQRQYETMLAQMVEAYREGVMEA